MRIALALRLPLLAIASGVLLALAGNASAQQNNSQLRKAIVAANAEFSAAFARGDGAGVAALYATNGKLLQPNGEIVSGREAIKTFWQGAIDSGLKQIKLETMEVHGAGATVAEVGAYSILAGNGQVLDKGKYVVVWKREQGKWRLFRDIWNSNNPARS